MGKIKLDISADSPYTGLLEPGMKEGMIRMGTSERFGPEGETTFPGIGWKFLRSGEHSGNFVTMHHHIASGFWNFFKLNQSNHLPPAIDTAKEKMLVKKFQEASQCFSKVGLADFTRYSQNGTKHATVKFPFKLFFIPSEEVQMPEKPITQDELLAQLSGIKAGTKVFSVWACGKPSKLELKPTSDLDACADALFLGDVITTSHCTTSDWGDNHLNFQHWRIEEDWQLEPSFLAYDEASASCSFPGPMRAENVPMQCNAEHPMFPPMLEDDASYIV